MMFQSLKKAWKSGSIMHDVTEHLARMTSDAEFIAVRGWEACAGRVVIEKMKPLLLDRDKEVNRAERTIRRLVVQHLTINPGDDVSGCLAIMLMAKDIERIGDHGRNVFQMAEILPDRIPRFRFYGELESFQSRICELLAMLRRAIAESDQEIAHQILERYKVLKREIKEFRNGLFSAGLACDEAVASTLLTRYARRMTAHVGNAASGVIFPVESIDFISRGLKEEEKDR